MLNMDFLSFVLWSCKNLTPSWLEHVLRCQNVMARALSSEAAPPATPAWRTQSRTWSTGRSHLETRFPQQSSSEGKDSASGAFYGQWYRQFSSPKLKSHLGARLKHGSRGPTLNPLNRAPWGRVWALMFLTSVHVAFMSRSAWWALLSSNPQGALS